MQRQDNIAREKLSQVFVAIYQGSPVVTQDYAVPGCDLMQFVDQPALEHFIAAEDAAGRHSANVRRAGERRSGTSAFSKSVWAFNGATPAKEWNSIEDGLHHLLDALTPKRTQLEPYFRQCSVYWWCGKFQSSFDGTLTLSPATLAALAKFGAPLTLASYFSEAS